MSKGQRTRVAIVHTALEQASAAGLEGLTIGALAEKMKMSKSGVFAHFGSREDLQIAVLQAFEESFIADVLKAAIPERRGLPRLVTLLRRWLARTEADANRRGCIWISGASEYDDRPGAVRDELVRMINGWRAELGRAIELAIAEGHLTADTDVAELIFNINGVILALHHDARLLRSADAPAMASRALDRLIDARRTGQAPAVSLATSAQTTPLPQPGPSTIDPVAASQASRGRPGATPSITADAPASVASSTPDASLPPSQSNPSQSHPSTCLRPPAH